MREGQHCITCDCDDPCSLGKINLRFLEAAGRIVERVMPKVSAQLLSRLSPNSSRYRFGFTGLKLMADSTRLVGQFLCAVRRPGRPADYDKNSEDAARWPYAFWEVSTVNPNSLAVKHPTAYGYNKGDSFRLPDDLLGVEYFLEWEPSDEELEQYLLVHIQPLVDAAEDYVRDNPEIEGAA